MYEVKYGVLDKREAGAVAKALRRKAVETGRPLREVGVVALDYKRSHWMILLLIFLLEKSWRRRWRLGLSV